MNPKRIILIVLIVCLNFLRYAESHQQYATIGSGPLEQHCFLFIPYMDHNIQNRDWQHGNDQKGNGGWEEMSFRSIKIKDRFVYFVVSSELEPINPYEGPGKYGGHNLFDDNPATAWVEGVKGQGTGEYVIFKTDKQFPQEIQIYNGYQKSERLFKLNSRPHTLLISLYAGIYLEGDDTEITSRYRVKQITEPSIIELDDRMGSQCFDIPCNAKNESQLKDSIIKVFREDFREEIEQRRKLCPSCDLTPRFSYFIKLEIRDVYEGSEWEDNCISGLSYTNNPVLPSEMMLSKPAKIINVYEDDDPDAGRILVDTDRRKGILLIDKKQLKEYEYLDDNQHMSITLMAVSPDKEWAQVDLMFYEKGAGRVEEYSALFNVRMNRRVSDTLLKTIYGVFGFVEKDGKIWLDTADGYIDLDKIREALRDE